MLRLSNLTLGYDRHPAVHHLDATIETGSLTAIVGPNGGGKSTLLKAIAGELRPMTGTIERDVPRRSVAYLPQASEIDTTFPIKVGDLVAMGLWRRIGPFGRVGASGWAAVADALAAVGLEGFEERPVSALSGGQRQRALFARLIVQDAPLVLLDEPFAALDQRTIDDLCDVIGRWHAEGRTILAVLHDVARVRAHMPRTMILARELVAHGSTGSVLSRANLESARAVPEAALEGARVCKRAA